MNIAPTNYIGPIKAEVGGAVWAYEWNARVPQEQSIIGVWLDAMGGPEVYSGRNEEK